MTVVTGASQSVGQRPREIHRAVHVVTVTHNSSSTLASFFAGLQANATAVGGVTIVDNASTDDTLPRATLLAADGVLAVEVLANVNDGFAGGYAAAVAASVDPSLPVLCLNPDVVLGAGVVEAMLDVLNSFDDAAVVTAPLNEVSGAPDTASRRRLPTFGGSAVYSVLGRFTPARLRYNDQRAAVSTDERVSRGGVAASVLEATTGALMLVAPDFRSLEGGIFDRDYWMYGEDLQLCADARDAGMVVLMAETTSSVHVKGVSSGRPRSRRSNQAFHHAMFVYARKNLVRSRSSLQLLRLAIGVHFLLSEMRAAPARLKRRRVRTSA